MSEMNADESGANRFQVATAATLRLRQCADSTKIYGMRNTVIISGSTNKPARIADEIMATRRAINRRRQELANRVWDAELLESPFFSGRYGVGVRCALLEVEAAAGRADGPVPRSNQGAGGFG